MRKQFNDMVLFPVPMDRQQREQLKKRAKADGYNSVSRWVRIKLGLEVNNVKKASL